MLPLLPGGCRNGSASIRTAAVSHHGHPLTEAAIDNAPSKKPFIAAFIGNSVIAASKFVAAAFTGSSAMIAEGVHSVVDSSNNLLMLLGIRLSQRKASAEHPFGHGKELYFWSLVVAMVLFGIGGGISAYEGVIHLWHPTPIKQPLWNYGVLAVAFIADGWTLVISYREFRKHYGQRGIWRGIHESKDPTKFIVVLEDSAATVGVLVAAAGIWLSQATGIHRFDGAASLIIGLLLCTVAIILAIESKNLLVGESAPEETVRAIRKTVENDPDVEAIRNLLTMQLGPSELLANLDVQFRSSLDFKNISEAIKRLEAAIRREHPQVKKIFIEARALTPDGTE